LVTDDSTDGIDPDVDGDDVDGTVDDDDIPDEDTPTPVSFDEAPLLGLTKRVTSAPASNGDGSYDVGFTIVAENLGDVALERVQIVDDLAATFATAGDWLVAWVASDSLTVAPDFDGHAHLNLLEGTDTLIAGASASVELVVTVTPVTALGPHWNTAVAAGASPAGTTVGDVSQDGVDADPDGNGDPSDNSDPTPVVFPALGSVTGTVWQDANVDGSIDPGEPRLENVTVTLVDPGPDGEIGSADDVVLGTFVTDASGQYVFVDIPGGDYMVVVDTATLPPQMHGTYDPDGVLDDMTAVTVAAGGASSGNDFGYVLGFNLWADKAASGGSQIGESMDFTIVIGNDGPSTAIGPISVSDVVPTAFDITAVTSEDLECTVADRTVECLMAGNLAVDATVSFTVRTEIVSGGGRQVENVVVVESTGPVPETDLTDNIDSVTVSIGELPRTGADLLRFAILGLLLLTAGAGLLAIARRREQELAAPASDG
jgi:uncharacterized repeat protein (TIGR01451 family)